MLSAWLCSLLMATPSLEDKPSSHPLVPWYVPRSASLGFFFNRDTLSPHVRLSWEWTVLDQPRNALAVVTSLGTGFGIEPPRPMTALFQHVGLLGFAYRSDRPILHWGFSALFGAVWYRAAFVPGSFPFENHVLPYAEGRIQVGVHVAPHLRLALYIGYASPFIYTDTRPGNFFVGGFDFGVVVDWR